MKSLAYQLSLLANGSRTALTEWLQWNDANGVYTDEDCQAEGLQSMSYTEARSMVLFAVAEGADIDQLNKLAPNYPGALIAEVRAEINNQA
jgi:hypothetical protein